MEKDFIDQLTSIPLTQRQYLSIGFERHSILWRINSYYVSKKPAAQQRHARDPLLRLVSNYELQYLQFGPLYFEDRFSKNDDYFHIGHFDDGLLCVSRHDHSVRIVRDICYDESLYNTDRLCSVSSSRFLNAIIPAAIYLEKCLVDNNLYEMPDMVEAMINYCSLLAGEGSADFFKVLLEGPANGVFI